MKTPKTSSSELLFILIFGLFHFAVPFILPPNFAVDTSIFGALRIADFVFPGTFIVAVASILFYATRNRYPGALLVFLYGGGITFHLLYLSGVFPSVLLIPSPLILVAGVAVDALAIAATYDILRRTEKTNPAGNAANPRRGTRSGIYGKCC
jgi:hypothetical protein